MAGSSHGSTTAARFSMHQPVDRVVMFCGPRDNTETWQGGHSATPPHRFFGFSHVLDKGWQEDHYCRSWQLLKMNQCGEVINVEKSLPPFENTRRLITDCDLKGNERHAHSGVVPKQSAFKNEEGAFRHEAVWKYLFLHSLFTSVITEDGKSSSHLFSFKNHLYLSRYIYNELPQTA